MSARWAPGTAPRYSRRPVTPAAVPCIRSCPLTREAKEFNKEFDTQERRAADPPIVESVEQRREVGPEDRSPRCPIDGLVSLAAEKREVVAKQVRGDALDAVRGALGRARPVFGSEADGQLNERGTLWF
jgi:hypothetical protein